MFGPLVKAETQTAAAEESNNNNNKKERGEGEVD